MKKNFLLIITLLFMSIAVFIGFNITQLDNEISNNQYNTLVNDLSIVANNFSIWISNKKNMLEVSKDTVNNFSYEEITKWFTENPYLNLNNDDPNVSQTYIGLSDGRFITGGQWVPPDDYDPRTRVWYQEAVAADATIVSTVYIDRETSEQIVTISSPLYLDNAFVGVISADVFLTDIHGYLDSQIKTKNTYAYILDQSGTVTMHSRRPELIGLNLYNDIKDQNIINYFEMAKANVDLVRMEYDYEDQEIRGIMKNIENGEWYLAVALENKQDLSVLRNFTIQHAIFNFIILATIFILILLIFRIKVSVDQLNQQLKIDNEKDFLTNIYNRRFFNVYMEKLWHNDEDQDVCILIMDIDHFKQYNDTYGHIQGDEVLKAVTKCIASHVRKEDVLARFGGEEFALILTGVTPDTALKIATTIKDAIFDLNLEHETSSFKRVTISVGIMIVKPQNGVTVRDAVDYADKALYKAKEQGRNRVVMY